MRTVSATRYVAPLREGGSLPGIVEADDLGTYVCKFRGAGQGAKVLVAEVIVGELARRLEIRTPDLVVVELDAAIGRYEADEEVQDLLTASIGPNLGVDFLPGSFGYDAGCSPDAETAARIMWLDALTANVDRSWRNPNLLLWHGDVWAIDHGACLYFHHGWSGGIGPAARFAAQPYDASDHVLSAYRRGVPAVDAELAPRVTRRAARGGRGTRARGVAGAGAGCRDDGRPACRLRRLPAGPGLGRAGLAAGGGRGMSARRPFQYVVLRCVPRVDREEFVNVGVVLYCQADDFLEARQHVSPERLRALAETVDVDAVCSALAAIEAVCRGDESAGAAGRAAMGTRFGFVKAPRSTVVQPGPVHGGSTTDPARELDHLLERLVG